MKTIGQNIAFYRKQNNLTQEDLADICMVTPQAVSKWENDGACPDVTLLKTIAKTFNVSVDMLLDDGTTPIAIIKKESIDIEKVMLKIKVNSGDGDLVNVNLPVKLIELMIKSDSGVNIIGGKCGDALKNIDFNQIISMISHGVVGKLVEVKTADGDTVEIFVE